ncbi:UGMP family protein [Candidatus Pacearchaeota archaeon]|nr:UGMP family protein [Candidatus Pacearchaeota archaeon]
MPIILGIESTAHTFGVGIVKNGKILANQRSMYTTKKGGIIPIDSAKHHAKCKNEIYNKALEEAGIQKKEIDAIAFSQGPGLAPCLLEGIKFAKELSNSLQKPIVPVNHCIAHLEIGKTTGAKDPVMLYASGANTQIIAYTENFSEKIRGCRKVSKEPCNASGKYRIFGETLDIGVGNFIDNFARYAGIGFPGGPKIEELARGETPQAYPEKSSAKIFTNGKNYIELPYKVKGMDITLSGILTNLRQKFESKRYPLNDLSYSLQETVFAMLVETAERALAHTGKKELLLGGGVACNSRLQEMCKIMCEERGAKFFCPEKSLLVDNGAMIAFLGEILFKNGIKFSHKELDSIDIKPRQRTDDVEVSWK